MALEAVWDTVTDAEVENSLIQGTRLVRTGIIKGMTTATVTSAKMALVRVLEQAPDIPELGEEFEPGYPSLICVHRVARGIPNTGGRMARVWIHYETPGGGGTPLERFYAEDSVVSQAEPTNVFPGTPIEILVSTSSSSPTYTRTTHHTDEHVVTINWPRSIRSLVLYGLFADRPSIDVANAVNTVNHSYWQGLGRGRWRLEGLKVRYSSRDGLYAVSAGFLTKGDGPGDDWSTYAVPLDPTNGKRVRVNETTLQTEYEKDYEYGVMNDKNGLGHWGPYQVSNFSALFGDTFPIGD